MVKTCHALYDYDKQTEEELTFKEGDQFNVFDLNDPDWLLVGDMAGQMYGFIPSNYIEFNSAAPTAQSLAPLPISSFAPPPVHKDLTPQPQLQPQLQPQQSQPEKEEIVDEYPEEEDEAPPPMPSRPGNTGSQAVAAAPRPAQPSNNSPPQPVLQDVDGNHKEHTFDGEYFKWFIDEVDGRKKRSVVLSVGNGLIILKPNTDNPKKLKLRSASSLDNNWRIRDLMQYNHEKKHVFLEFRNPTASIELHAGTKDVAEAIVTILGDLKGVEEAKGLKEVARASLTKASGNNKRIGVLLYDFRAQGDDELSVREGDEIYIVDLSKSKEWWMCERVSDGKQGVVPSSYIEITGTTNLDKLTAGVTRRKSERAPTSSKGRIIDGDSSSKKKLYNYNRDERERIRESDRIKRDKNKSKKDDKSMPNYHRVRTWIDSTGSFKVEAEFLGCVEGKIHLHKSNGVKIAVAATKLSIEDLEYVEKVTGTSLESYKEEVARQSQRRSPVKGSRSSGVGATSPVQDNKHENRSRSATAVINDVTPSQPTRPTTGKLSVNEPDYDWFDFFLQCGVDIGNCQRYSINFGKEQMDESVLEDITPSLLRSLGLREGDILRVMKFLDNKFNRKKQTADEAPSGGLFTEATGALKNNSTTQVSKVSASALPTPSTLPESSALPSSGAQGAASDKSTTASKFEDDAWAVKPAARSSEDITNTAQNRPHYTGSLQDLVDIKPLESTQPQTPNGTEKSGGAPTAPTLTPVKTGTLIQPNQQFTVQKTGNGTAPLNPVRTGNAPNLVPVQTGGMMPAQPTGFVAIGAQPTGFVPIQATGGIVPQLTIGIVPLQTGSATFAPPPMGGQKTGEPMAGPPPTTFGLPAQTTSSFVPLQPGNVTMPATSFNQTTHTGGFSSMPNLASQVTGGVMQGQMTGGPMMGQMTGGPVMGQMTGGAIKSTFVPQSAFGKQITGGFMSQPSQTGFGQSMPPTSFGQQTGGMPSTTFGQQTGGNMPTSFGQQTGGMMPATSFGQQTGGMMPTTSFGQQTGGMMPTTSFGQQTGGMMPTSSFGQPGSMPPTSFGQPGNNPGFNQPMNPAFGQNTGMPPTSFGTNNFAQSQPSYGQPNNFSQPNYGQPNYGQPNVGQVTSMFQNTSIGSPYGQPQNFGASQFEGFGNQPLQAQPTGAGFGNGPSLQPQQTGRRANLQAASADNPFGF